MTFAYAPDVWQNFFAVVSLAAATLTGLLAVALSVNVRAVMDNPAYMARAREALIALTVLLTLSIFALIPQQGRVALGIELVVLSILVFVVSLRLQADTMRRLRAPQRRRWMARLVGLNAATFAITLAGTSLIIGRLGGLLWLLYTTVICLVWSTYNAWGITIRVPSELEREHAEESRRAKAVGFGPS